MKKYKKIIGYFIQNILPLVICIVLSLVLYLYITKDGIKTTDKNIRVQILGAVKSPGLKELKSGAVISDLINAAEGFSEDYDPIYVESKLNLAKKLKDGDNFSIPSKSKALPTTSPITGTKIPTSSSPISGTKININTATISELDTLSGIGETTAKKIIANRPYTKLYELIDKKVLTKSVYDKIESKITL